MYSSSGSARRASSSSQIRNSSRISSRAASMFRASLSPPGSDCSYCLPVAFSHSVRACQYSALNRQMQLSWPLPHGSRGRPVGSASACLISFSASVLSMSAQRRRSTAISVPMAPIFLVAMGGRKFCLYWTQSQTMRSVARSAGEAQTASMIGPSACLVAADSRSLRTGRRSTSIVHPGPGVLQDVGDGPLVPGHQQVDSGHALDLRDLLDDLGGELDALFC